MTTRSVKKSCNQGCHWHRRPRFRQYTCNKWKGIASYNFSRLMNDIGQHTITIVVFTSLLSLIAFPVVMMQLSWEHSCQSRGRYRAHCRPSTIGEVRSSLMETRSIDNDKVQVFFENCPPSRFIKRLDQRWYFIIHNRGVWSFHHLMNLVEVTNKKALHERWALWSIYISCRIRQVENWLAIGQKFS